jgi:hypothetical protein
MAERAFRRVLAVEPDGQMAGYAREALAEVESMRAGSRKTPGVGP